MATVNRAFSRRSGPAEGRDPKAVVEQIVDDGPAEVALPPLTKTTVSAILRHFDLQESFCDEESVISSGNSKSRGQACSGKRAGRAPRSRHLILLDPFAQPHDRLDEVADERALWPTTRASPTPVMVRTASSSGSGFTLKPPTLISSPRRRGSRRDRRRPRTSSWVPSHSPEASDAPASIAVSGFRACSSPSTTRKRSPSRSVAGAGQAVVDGDQHPELGRAVVVAMTARGSAVRRPSRSA